MIVDGFDVELSCPESEEALYKVLDGLEELRYKDVAAYLASVENLLGTAKKEHNRLAEGLFSALRADAWRIKGSMNECLAEAHHAVLVLQGFRNSRAYVIALNSLGMAQAHLGSLTEGFNNLTAAYELAESLKLGREAAGLCLNLSYWYSLQGDNDRSYRYCSQITSSLLEFCSTQMKLILYVNMSGCLIKKKRYVDALDLVDRGLALTDRESNARMVGFLSNNKASIMAALGDENQAEELVKLAEDIYRDSNYLQDLPYPVSDLGEIYMGLGLYSKAIDAFERGLALAEESGIPNAISTLSAQLSRGYESVGRFQESLQCLKKTVSLIKDQSKSQINLAVQNAAKQHAIWLEKEAELRADSAAAHIAAKEAAELATKLKSEFLATMTHEVRTPITGIKGLATLLQNSNLNSEQLELVSHIHHASDQLLDVVGDVLDLSKIESGNFEVGREVFDLPLLLVDLKSLFEPMCREKGVEFELRWALEDQTVFQSDPTRIRQVLSNLIGNAIKFTQKGKITVLAETKESDSSSHLIRFSVTDTGIGIPDNRLQAIFDPYQQGDKETYSRFGGTGLGLSICNRMVKLMGGSIGVESQVDVGSTFWFELNLQRAEGEVISDGVVDLVADESMPLKGFQILVSEDNDINWLISESILTSLGALVTQAKDGIEAVSMAIDYRYDVIIMDCHMPNMDGYEATRQIRHHESEFGIRTPIIAFSADGMEDNEELCRLAGMDGFLTKPMRAPELVACIMKLISKKRT